MNAININTVKINTVKSTTIAILSLLTLTSLINVDASYAEEGFTVKKEIVFAKREISGTKQTKLDLYIPKTGKDHAIMIWVHGGGWQIGDKSRVHYKPEFFTKMGFVLVSVNYRLFPEAGYEEQTEDVASAIRWAYDHAKEFSADKTKISIIGHSSGAHLAALISTDERFLKAEKLTLDNIKGTILLDGAGYNIPRQLKEFAGIKNKHMYEKIFGTDIKEQTKASPITHVAKEKGISPFLILYVADRDSSKAQSHALAKSLTEIGVQAKAIGAENKTHGTINREIGIKDDPPTVEIKQFLKEMKK